MQSMGANILMLKGKFWMDIRMTTNYWYSNSPLDLSSFSRLLLANWVYLNWGPGLNMVLLIFLKIELSNNFELSRVWILAIESFNQNRLSHNRSITEPSENFLWILCLIDKWIQIIEIVYLLGKFYIMFNYRSNKQNQFPSLI